MKFSKGSAVALAATILAGGSAHAAAMLSPVSATVIKGGTAGTTFFSINNVINQSGLAKTYAPGVTQFEDYISGAPTHGVGLGTRWLSAGSVDSATLVFDFGTEVTLSKLAWWDDQSTTVRSISLSTSDKPGFASFKVADPNVFPATAQVFAFAPITTRYLTLDISGCNLGIGTTSNWSGCGLNEIAFAEGVIAPAGVPEPATWAMMILGLGAAGAVVRRRRTVPA